ncbi:hypothetical protein AgCh_003733 [Apium graveolens]
MERICKSQQGEAKDAENEYQDEEQLFVASCFSAQNTTKSWLINSGCTNHMTYNRELFRDLDETVVFKNVLSVSQLTEKGYKVLFDDNNCVIKDARGVDIFKVPMKGKSFVLDLTNEELAAVHKEDNNTMLWHKRWGHFHHAALLFMEKNMARGLPALGDEPPKCVACHHGKQNRLPFQQNNAWRATEKLQLIHTDVAGPMCTPSLNGRIEHQLTAPYTPQQNGVVERKNRTIMEMARCLLHDKGMPQKFWAEAAHTSILLLNRLPKKALRKMTPFEVWIYQPQNNQITINRDIHFLESEKWNWENDEQVKIQEDDNVDDDLVRGTRLLSEIHQKCNVALMEPAGYEAAATDRKWYKARLVVKGYAQIYGVDFSETFAPVARMETIRMLLALAAQKGWTVHQMDAKLAFLNGLFEEEIFVEQPEGFVCKGQEDKQLESDDRFKEEMKAVFEMTDLGKMTFFLGMDVQQNTNEIFICQKKYAKEILKKFNMDECKPFTTPMNNKERFCEKDGAPKVDEGLYRSLIGCLMDHNKGGYYECCTTDFGIKFSQVKNFRLHGYVDSDLAGCEDDMKNTLGYCFSFGSGVFSWCSKKLEITAQSTAKFEFVAATAAVNQALWLRKLMMDLHMEQHEGTTIFVDNQAALSIADKPVFHDRTKHFKIKFYFLREVQREGELQNQGGVLMNMILEADNQEFNFYAVIDLGYRFILPKNLGLYVTFSGLTLEVVFLP